MSEKFDTERVEALKASGLIATCPSDCQGTGRPTVLHSLEGEPVVAVECDCGGLGWYVTDEATERFFSAAVVLKHWPLEQADPWGYRAALSTFLIEFAVERGPNAD